MARPRTFDEAEALDAAVECFWQHGLEGTSVRDVAAEMGLNCPSLYNAFGDKRALFAQVLERYAERFLHERVRRLTAANAPKAAIHGFFEELIVGSLADPDKRGCLIINSALQVAPDDSELRAAIAGHLVEIESFFREQLQAGQNRGEIPANLDPQDTARLLLGVVLGLRVMARTKADRTLLEGMVRPALAILDDPHHLPAKGNA